MISISKISKKYFVLGLLLLYSLQFLSVLQAQEAEEQLPYNEVPVPYTQDLNNYGDDLDDETNYGLNPGNPSYDSKTNPSVEEAAAYVNRKSINFAPFGVAKGIFMIEYEGLPRSNFGLGFGAVVQHSDMEILQALENAAGLNPNGDFFASVAGRLYIIFYPEQKFQEGFYVKLVLGGGVIFGNYTESYGGASAVSMQDFFGGFKAEFGWKIALGRHFTLAPQIGLGANLVIVNETFANVSTVPIFHMLNVPAGLFSVAAILNPGILIPLSLDFGLVLSIVF